MDDMASSKTFASQGQLPKLPIPPLEDTCRRYLKALEALQDEQEHADTKAAVQQFLEGDGPRVHQKLIEYAKDKASYIEEFWYESYLSHSDPVVLALNPFFVLENDPTPDRGSQIPRAASLIVSSLGFIHDLRCGILEPDTVRGTALDMDQYTRLFGTARIPTDRGCRMEVYPDSKHIVVLRRGQFYWFDVLDEDNLPLMTEREILRNLQAIVSDADNLKPSEVARKAIGVLSTENRKVWSGLRKLLQEDRNNAGCLQMIDRALFVVCLDDTTPEDLADLCSNFLCGTYNLQDGEQVGTCTNRWYDKLQIIVCHDGAAGINFEHTGVDGLRQMYLLKGLCFLLVPSILQHQLSFTPLYLRMPSLTSNVATKEQPPTPPLERIDTTPKKLEWKLSPEIRAGVRFAETRISDLICQNDCQALEFKGYGKNFITSHGFSPDAFVQMAFQAAYFGLYGRIECVYEPAMTKAYLHGRTEAIRSVQHESINFTKTFYSESTPQEKIHALRQACERHVKLTKECSQGLGQDRHLYAMYCLVRREIEENKLSLSARAASPSLARSPTPSTSPSGGSGTANKLNAIIPSIFTDPGYSHLSTSILSTSNCGNPALRLFGFGPVAADGYGIGYIIKENGISICASSKHLQTRRFLDTLQGYLYEIQRILVQVHRAANERPAPFVDHLGILRDSKTGRPINGTAYDNDTADEDGDAIAMPGYSFFDSGEVELLGRRKKTPYANVGKVIPLVEY